MKTQTENRIVIFDFMRTLYDPDQKALTPGAFEVLDTLHAAGVMLFMVSRKEGQRMSMLDQLGIETFFSQVFLVESKEKALHELVERYPDDQKWIVGDRVCDEIRCGNEFSMITVWYKQGVFGTEHPRIVEEKPDFTIQDMKELITLMDL